MLANQLVHTDLDEGKRDRHGEAGSPIHKYGHTACLSLGVGAKELSSQEPWDGALKQENGGYLFGQV